MSVERSDPPAAVPRPDRDPGARGKVYRPRLLCRSYAGDVGVRPLPSNVNFVLSPDIWVTDPSGAVVPLNTKTNLFGQPHRVHVCIWNRGFAGAYAAFVECFTAHLDTAGNPASPPLVIDVPLGAQPVALMGGERRVVWFPWIPEPSGHGRPCLLARVYHPLTDKLAFPTDPRQDHHVAAYPNPYY